MSSFTELPFSARYRGIVQDKWYRHFFALLASSYQMMGTIAYIGAEWRVGFEHLPAYVSPSEIDMHAYTHTLQPSLLSLKS